MGITRKASVALVIGIALVSSMLSTVDAASISPDAYFSVRDEAPDGIPDSLSPGGVLTELGTFVDEAFIEFPIGDLAGTSATFNFTLRINRSPYDPLDVKIAFYDADGVASLADFGTGTYFTEVRIPHPGSHRYSLDVTALVSEALSRGQSHIGFRFYDPISVTTGEGKQAFLDEGTLADTFPNISFSSYLVDDDNLDSSSGNGNGKIDPGETIELHITLQNSGSGNATGVSVVLSTTDPFVIFPDGTSSGYPDIPAKGTGANLDAFVFSVDPACPIGHIIQFDLAISSNEGSWTDSFIAVVQGDLNISIPPAARFMVRDEGPDGIPDSLALGGVLSELKTFVDEAFIEFPIGGLDNTRVIFNFELRINVSPYDPLDVNIGCYDADGAASATDFGTGAFLTEIRIPHLGNHHYLLDVTPVVSDALSRGQSHIGFRFYDPVSATTGEGKQAVLDEGILVNSVPHISFSSYLADDYNLNNRNSKVNGRIDPAETIKLYATLRNTGTGDATGVSGGLSTNDPFVIFSDSTCSGYPDIPAKGTGSNLDAFVFSVDPACPIGHIIQFDLAISSNEGSWTDSFIAVVQGDLEFSIPPAARFWVRDQGSDGIPDSLSPGGVLTELGIFVDEAFIEFPIVGLEKTLVIFDFGLRVNASSYPPVDVKIATYDADGILSVADFGSGSFLTQITVPYPGNVFSINVTSLVRNALGRGKTYIGFRFYDPISVTTGEGKQAFLDEDEGSLRARSLPPMSPVSPVLMLLLDKS